MKNKIVKLLFVGSLTALSLQSCTDLTEKVYDRIEDGDFLKNDAQIAAALGPAYGGLGGITWDWFNPNEASSDELIVPTRGGDWFDNGDWLAYSRHTWTPSHGPINGSWGFLFGNISTINQLIPKVSANKKAVDELRALRAFYYLQAVDMFGNVPISTETLNDGATKPRAEVYAFIEKELLEIIPNLPTTKVYSKINQSVANMILAKLYLNAGVYKGTTEWQKAYDVLNKVIPNYSLETSTLANFTLQNQGSAENIFVVPYDSKTAEGMTFQMRTLHYENQKTYGLGNSPWNGFCTLADFYNSFDDKDLRKKMWIAGQQFAASGSELKDAKGAPLVFVADFKKDQMTDADPEYQVAGVRAQKYEIQRNNPSGHQDNDFVIFRLSDAVLMKAEAAFRLARNAEAITEVNKIRTRAGMAPFTTLTAATLLAERGREMAWEGWRRSDLIRFGEFNKERKFMKNTKDYSLFPIPQARIDANPKLVQNPAYK